MPGLRQLEQSPVGIPYEESPDPGWTHIEVQGRAQNVTTGVDERLVHTAEEAGVGGARGVDQSDRVAGCDAGVEMELLIIAHCLNVAAAAG